MRLKTEKGVKDDAEILGLNDRRCSRKVCSFFCLFDFFVFYLTLRRDIFTVIDFITMKTHPVTMIPLS